MNTMDNLFHFLVQIANSSSNASTIVKKYRPFMSYYTAAEKRNMFIIVTIFCNLISP